MRERWIQLWDGREVPSVLAFLRITVALIVLWDLGTMLALADDLYGTPEAGGLGSREVGGLVQTLGPTGAVALAAVAMACFGAGLGTPVAGLVWVLTSAALAQRLPSADRGIDMLLRNIVLVLSLSAAGRMWSVGGRLRTGRWRGDDRPAPSWPRLLLLVQLVVVYSMAGVQKFGLSWTPFGGWSALWLVLHDPAYARGSPHWLGPFYPLTQVATLSVWLWECSTPLLLIVLWARGGEGGGPWREWIRRNDPARAWALFGLLFHVGIGVAMNLGIFAPAMVALYPVLWGPERHPLRWLRAGTG